ncbi:MAG: hypothetical protein HOM11_03845 [Methylococcales bacterium]|nr:hypothetical protein [Methylococcales bacterium]MBT7442982.1 hypothetical protein [Methylococcales bacterium]
MKHQLLGYVGSSPEYDAVADAYENKTMCALSNATWSRWWNGECMPDSKAKTVIEREIPGLVNNWLKFDVNNRLQRAHSQKVGKTYCKVAT